MHDDGIAEHLKKAIAVSKFDLQLAITEFNPTFVIPSIDSSRLLGSVQSSHSLSPQSHPINSQKPASNSMNAVAGPSGLSEREKRVRDDIVRPNGTELETIEVALPEKKRNRVGDSSGPPTKRRSLKTINLPQCITTCLLSTSLPQLPSESPSTTSLDVLVLDLLRSVDFAKIEFDTIRSALRFRLVQDDPVLSYSLYKAYHRRMRTEIASLTPSSATSASIGWLNPAIMSSNIMTAYMNEFKTITGETGHENMPFWCYFFPGQPESEGVVQELRAWSHYGQLRNRLLQGDWYNDTLMSSLTYFIKSIHLSRLQEMRLCLIADAMLAADFRLPHYNRLNEKFKQHLLTAVKREKHRIDQAATLERVIGYIQVNNNHWVAFQVDLPGRLVLVSDSLDPSEAGISSDSVRELFSKVVEELEGELFNPDLWRYQKASIKDTSSCGPLTIITMALWAQPISTTPLVYHSPRFTDYPYQLNEGDIMRIRLDLAKSLVIDFPRLCEIYADHIGVR